jgi:hypothetical protein
MSNEDIKFIAECLFPNSKKAFIDYPDEEKFEAFCDGIAARNFNPYESWNDCGLVLKDMVMECDIEITQSSKRFYITNNSYANSDGEGDTLMDAICQAYISLKRGE